MDRPIGWTKALRRYAAEMNGRPFAWAETDCVTVVRGGVEVVLGRDPFDFTFTTEIGAKRVWRRFGSAAGSLEDAGAVPVPRAFVMQGDVLVNPEPEGHPVELAIVVGNGILGATTEGGVYWRSVIPEWDCWRLPGGSRVGTDG